MNTAPNNIENLAIVIVTFKRRELLELLLRSVVGLKAAPWRVFVIDNEGAPETEALVNSFAKKVAAGESCVLWPENGAEFRYVGMHENTGGAGGFAEGVKRAHADGAKWFWLMDDDVEVMPDAIANLAKWTPRFDAIQGSRLDYDGGAFYWQYRFIEPLGMYNPIASDKRDASGYRAANALCFEGALFSRSLVDKLGPPDARFFIYWDDCVYGYLASKHGEIAHVDDVILKRARDVNHWEISGVRQLNSTSDMTRYFIMRNRGHMANYMKLQGDFVPPLFAIGTCLCAAKEIIRLIAIDRANLSSGLTALRKGWQSSRKILRDKNWKPVTNEWLQQ